MRGSKDMQRQQKTSYEGSSVNNRMESEGILRAPSIPMAPTKETSSAATDNLLEVMLTSKNILEALKRVEKNKGSHGIDGMKVDELRPLLRENWRTIKDRILEGTYKPQPVGRVEIPKPDGGKRLLGIPTVLDRSIASRSRGWPRIINHLATNALLLGYQFKANIINEEIVFKACEETGL
ncbi:hypothetical protein [Anaerobranca gottschalkii]|uniref:Group II intron reverse transcriptase/maturase n=1 Tax=Anaerobranca gottschalkii DSM 13577 TaxID=1120990 RepID=A0A1I0C9R6_9FIRM|nr:hypothetical protein [Anaerobranca gottschalkii]SET16317.1 hypothetical protein SAMN03080614_10652 [Anaerobranca gottschalkii DSM 13577]